jgi:PAS domain S-box-containing protein
MPRGAGAGRLFLGTTIALAAVLALGAESLRAYVSATRWVDHSLEVRKDVYEWLESVIDAETGARGYIATERPVFLEPYRSGVSRERTAAAGLRSLLADNPVQVRGMENAERDARVMLDDLNTLVALVTAGHADEARARLGQSKQRMDQFRADNAAIRAEEQRMLVERRTEATSRGLVALLAALLLGISSCALLAFAWRREGAHYRLAVELAAEARARLKALSELAAALSETRSRAHVAQVVVDHGLRAAGADTCTLYELDATGKVLDLIGDRGVAADVLEKIRRITETSGNPGTFATMKLGEATWAENDADYAKIYPSLATMKTPGRRARAFWSMPLVAEGRPLGLLGVGFYEPRKFSEDDRALVETLAKHCAQALLRAARLEGEDEARRWFTTTLRSIGDAVIATDGGGRVTFMNPVAESLTGWTEGDARGRPLDEVFSIFSEQTRAVVESPVSRVLREGGVVGLANHTLLRSKRGVEIPIDDSGAPIRNESGRILGVVLVFRDVTQDKRDRARSEFLAKAGEALVASIDYQSTLATIARFAVPTLADWCAVNLLEPGTTVPKQVAVAHVDESKVRLARELGERYPPDPNLPGGSPRSSVPGNPSSTPTSLKLSWKPPRRTTSIFGSSAAFSSRVRWRFPCAPATARSARSRSSMQSPAAATRKTTSSSQRTSRGARRWR